MSVNAPLYIDAHIKIMKLKKTFILFDNFRQILVNCYIPSTICKYIYIRFGEGVKTLGESYLY